MIRKRLLDPRDSEAAPPENELFRAAYLLGKRRVIPVTPSLLRETLGARAGSVFERVCGWPFYRFAVWSGALVFLVTGAAKVHWLYVASEGELVRRNHLFEFLSDAQTLALAATLEIIVAVYALAAFGRRPKLASAAIVWLCSTFAFYRSGLWVLGYDGSACHCLGQLETATIFGKELDQMVGLLLGAIFVPNGLVYLALRSTRTRVHSECL